MVLSIAQVTEMFVAAYGWDHDRWTGRFYPDDMPEEWRLSYYATRFRAVVVPAAAWTDADPAILRGWLEDTDPEFRFFLEWPTGAEPEQLSSRIALLSDSLGGAVVSGSISAGRLPRLPICRLAAPGEAARGPGELAALRAIPEGGPKGLRRQIEALAAAGRGVPQLLCCGDSAEAPEWMQSAQVIIDLLGLG